MIITCYSKNGKSYSWYIKKKDALRAGIKFEFKFFSVTFEDDMHVLTFHKDHHEYCHRLHVNKNGKAGPAFTCNALVRILEPGEQKTVYDLLPGGNNSDMVRFHLEPESKVEQLRVEQVAPQMDTERLVSFITEAKDNSIELLNLTENGNQTKKTRAIAGIYRAEIEEAEYLIDRLSGEAQYG